MADFRYPITALLPVLRTTDEQAQAWLVEAIKSLPKGMPYLLAMNSGKGQMHEALNEALAAVTTDFVWIMGSDDRAGRGTIDKLYSSIGTADVAYPSMRLMRAKGSTIGYAIADVFSINRLQDENLCGVFLARTEAIRAVGGWRHELIEDWDLVKRMAENGARFVAVPEAKYQYRIHRTSLSHRIQEHADEIGRDSFIESAPGLVERKPMLATFYCGTGAQVSYVRSQIPAKHLPGVARRTWDASNRHKTPAAIFEHWYDRVTWDLAAKQGRARLIDVDDQYLSNFLQRDMRKLYGGHAGGWEDSQRVHRQIAREADAVICSTIPLAYKYAEVSKNVHVIPNMVDPDDWSEIHPLRLDDTIRVCWPAGKQHWPDADLIEPAMRWASTQPNVEVSCIGLDPGWDFDYHYEPFTPSPQTYRDILSMMDVVLAPVKPTDMTRAKSDIKWLEAAMVGAPLVASNVEAYGTVEHGETGFIARGRKDFLRYVKLLVSSQEERLRVGRAAHDQVLATRDARDPHISRVPYMQVLQTCGVGTIEREEVAA